MTAADLTYRRQDRPRRANGDRLPDGVPVEVEFAIDMSVRQMNSNDLAIEARVALSKDFGDTQARRQTTST